MGMLLDWLIGVPTSKRFIRKVYFNYELFVFKGSKSFNLIAYYERLIRPRSP